MVILFQYAISPFEINLQCAFILKEDISLLNHQIGVFYFMLSLCHVCVWMGSNLGYLKLLTNCGTFSVLDYEKNIDFLAENSEIYTA